MPSKEWYQQKALEYYEGYYAALSFGDTERAELCDKWYKHYNEGGKT